MGALGAVEFNTRLARRLGRALKKELGASSVRQNYRGTGAQNNHRRQLWCRGLAGLPHGFTDLWLEQAYCDLGGVSGLMLRPVPYENRTPAEVCAAVVAALRTAMGGTEAA